MLSKLTIRNVALIENAEIEFSEGLNVLSGETGAGKSVILDSVNFVLGAKADRAMIRHGESECMVKAEFIVSTTSKAYFALNDLDIETDGEIIISRKFSETGKTSIKINGNTVTAAMLRRVTDSLVDVHGQSEHFFLLQESNQLKMLDSVIGKEVVVQKEQLKALLKEKNEIKDRIALLGGNEQERGRRLDVLKFQIEEIEAADLQENEEEELLAKRNKINNIEKIISALKEANAALSDENGALDALRFATRAISVLTKLSEEYAVVAEKLDGVIAEAEDIAETLVDFGNDLYFDENEAENIESRLELIRGLKRKYGRDLEEINGYLEKIQAEYDLLSDCEGQYAVLTEEYSRNQSKIYAICREITKIRKSYGKDFCDRVTRELKTLNINSAQCAIEFNEYTEENIERANSGGMDEICFMFSANAGEPMKPLGKIISGGEMSRFMLAIKTQLSQVNEIGTYIFDEIDAGISGKTAKVVGEKLATIAKNTQIIAVSHLAQIASMSDEQFLIEKEEKSGKTITKVYALDQQERIKEIVRLLGGSKEDSFAYKHAEELMQQAEEYKNSL